MYPLGCGELLWVSLLSRGEWLDVEVLLECVSVAMCDVVVIVRAVIGFIQPQYPACMHTHQLDTPKLPSPVYICVMFMKY